MQACYPEPGIWYVNHVGQLIQVRTVLYVERVAHRVLIEFINGRRESFDMHSWFKLNLSLHIKDACDQEEQDNHNILID